MTTKSKKNDKDAKNKMYSQNQAHKDSESTLKIRSLKTDETM